MTIHDDRNPNADDTSMDRAINAKRRADAEGWSTTTLFLGGLAALAIIFGTFFMMSGGTTQNTAGRIDPPAQPRATETTGSGAVIPPAPSPSPNR